MTPVPRASRQSSLTCSWPPKASRARRRASSRAHARTHVLVHLIVEVEAQFFVQVGFDGFAAKDGAQAIEQIGEHGGTSGVFQYLGDGRGEFLPAVGFDFELFAAGAGELVILRAAVVLRCAPTGLDPATALEAMEGGIKRTLLDAEDIARYLLDAFRDGPAVLRPDGERSEDEEVECALRQVNGWQWVPLVLLQGVILQLL